MPVAEYRSNCCGKHQCHVCSESCLSALISALTSGLEGHACINISLVGWAGGGEAGIFRLLAIVTNLLAIVLLQQIRQLQKASEGHQQEVAVMHDCMTQIMTELTTLGRAAEAAAASVHYETEQKESMGKMSSLHDRVQVLQQVIPDCTLRFQPPQALARKQQGQQELLVTMLL